ncbi:MAG: DUF4864 domain-containing protein [Candidatus Acidiferrales bacterium]
MDDPQANSGTEQESTPPVNSVDTEYAGREEREQNSATLRRFGVLLFASLVAFSLTTWLLVRAPLSLPPEGRAQVNADPAPAELVRAHLQALRSGDLRAAYKLFSERYRRHMKFEEFHQLVVSHAEIFQARKIALENIEETPARAVLDAHVTTGDDEEYIARYTLVQSEGEWTIDDVRWRREAESPGRITT